MGEMGKKERADATYQTLIESLNNRNWKYEVSTENRSVHFCVTGEDLPMEFIVRVDEERQQVYLMSQLPFTAPEDKRTEVAIATVIASYGLIAGNFDYDLFSGRCWFRMTESYMGRTMGDGLFQYLLSMSFIILEQFNDKLFMVSQGMLQATDLFDMK